MNGSRKLCNSRRKNLSPLSLALALACTVGFASAALAASPGEEIKNLVEQVLTILHNPALQDTAHKEQRVNQVEQLAARHFDYREMAKRCLGDTWDTLGQAQQKEYVGVFTALLKASFACRIDELAKAKVNYQPEIIKGDYTEVPIVIMRPNDKIPVNFRLLKEPEGWKIYDLVIEGVSLTDIYRSQFARVIKGSSYKELIRVLQVKMQEECKPPTKPQK